MREDDREEDREFDCWEEHLPPSLDLDVRCPRRRGAMLENPAG